MTTPEEDANLATAAALTVAAERYPAGESSGTEFAQELVACLSDDVVFRSNYTPTWEPVRPLFAERRGIDEIVARYGYENEHEVIHGGSGMPVQDRHVPRPGADRAVYGRPPA